MADTWVHYVCIFRKLSRFSIHQHVFRIYIDESIGVKCSSQYSDLIIAYAYSKLLRFVVCLGAQRNDGETLVAERCQVEPKISANT
jgi:hypothetical protein